MTARTSFTLSSAPSVGEYVGQYVGQYVGCSAIVAAGAASNKIALAKPYLTMIFYFFLLLLSTLGLYCNSVSCLLSLLLFGMMIGQWLYAGAKVL